mgnify:CR=1 FL=1
MKKYLTVQEFCHTIGYRPQTLYNKINASVLVENVHFLKPSKRKILFREEDTEKILEAISTRIPKDPQNQIESNSLNINNVSGASTDSRIKI